MPRAAQNRADDRRFLTYDTFWRRGVQRPVSVPSPAAETDWSVNVPGGVHWRLIGGSADFVADATVGNRVLGVLMTIYGVPVYVNKFNPAVVASSNLQVVYQLIPVTAGTTTLVTASDTFAIVPLTPLFLPAGAVIQSATTFIGAADQYSDITLIVEEVLDSDDSYTMREWEREDAWLTSR